MRDAAGDGARAAGVLLEDLRRAPLRPRRSSRAPAGWASTSPRAPSPCAWRRTRRRPARGRRGPDAAPGGLVLRRGAEIDALLPASARAEERARAIAARLRTRGRRLLGHEPSPGRLHAALREADWRSRSCARARPTRPDAAAGAWQLLVRLAVTDPGALRRLRDTSVGPALAHDADHGSDLVGTFRTYLAHGANMNAAAAAIPSHRHTVAYRLERLRELTGLHPARADDRERLGLGVKAQARPGGPRGGTVGASVIQEEDGAMYDYVIVGAGSAGCVVADRLGEDPDVKVAVIEAGPPDDAPGDPHPARLRAEPDERLGLGAVQRARARPRLPAQLPAARPRRSAARARSTR